MPLNCLIDIKGWGTKNKEAEFLHHRLIFYVKNVSFCIFDIIHRLEIVGALAILEMFLIRSLQAKLLTSI